MRSGGWRAAGGVFDALTLASGKTVPAPKAGSSLALRFLTGLEGCGAPDADRDGRPKADDECGHGADGRGPRLSGIRMPVARGEWWM